ncbi:MAG: ectoine/hydroxyectoine ABC transporter ATP-binding protein EhuA [Vicinamibacteraceae bacterium]
MTGNEPAAKRDEAPIVRIQGLHKRFGALEVLRGLDLEIPEGQVVSIIGPSGSGKSTLLRMLMTLDRPDSGRIEIAGESLYTVRKDGRERPAGEAHVRRVRRNIGMVFQHFNLFPHMTVLQNVTEAPVHVLGLSKAEAEHAATADLERVGLGDKLTAYPAELSGGQKQRVAIARALAMHPRIMLFDEITSALDPELVGGILDLLRELAASGETTMLIVTHVMSFARRCSHRVLFFDHGVVLEDAHPEEIFTAPRHERAREFLASILET